jgi:RNA polymerase sigma-70 factor (ECF subfamily)
MPAVSLQPELAEAEPRGPAPAGWRELYELHFDFVWRSLRRLGVPLSGVDDAAHEVFLVAFRKLEAFEHRSSLKTWLFAIAWRVARRAQRARTGLRAQELSDELADEAALDPHERAARGEAVRLLYAALDELDPVKRSVFVMAELEQLSAPEIAETIGVPLNTVYSRLRAARKHFNEAIARRSIAREQRT